MGESSKKIGDLQAEVAHLKAQLVRVKAPPRPAGYRDFSAAWPTQLHPPFPGDELRLAWAKWAAHRAEIGKAFQGQTGEPADLEKLGRIAAGDPARALKAIADSISGGWHNLSVDDKKTHSHATASATSKPGTARHHVPQVSSYGKL
jgi:hypothetical protein